MIELQIRGCCEDCENIELELTYYYANSVKQYILHCRHEGVCGDLKQEKEDLYK